MMKIVPIPINLKSSFGVEILEKSHHKDLGKTFLGITKPLNYGNEFFLLLGIKSISTLLYLSQSVSTPTKGTSNLGRQSTSLPGPRLLGALARLVLAEK